MAEEQLINLIVPDQYSGQRLDQVLAELLPYCSRSRLQRWIKAGHIKLNGQSVRTRERVFGNEHITGYCPADSEVTALAQAIPLAIIYEDRDIIVINKPAGLVVHPAAGNPDGTLLNALLNHAPELEHLPRAGIVHRLDKDTSGLLVVARSQLAHTSLVAQLQARHVRREYLALVNGVVVAGGTIIAPIGRHARDRKRMAVTDSGKEAITHYKVIERFRAHTLTGVKLETGRTHQIRVHMAYKHFPLLGDSVYGGRLRLPPGMIIASINQLRGFRRQALHACRLGLSHPRTMGDCHWQTEPPEDMLSLIATLRDDRDQQRLQKA